MSKHTRTPWEHVELVNENESSLTPEDAAEYSANTAKHESTGFYAVQAIKEDGKLYLEGIMPFVEYSPEQIKEMAQILYAQGYRKPERN